VKTAPIHKLKPLASRREFYSYWQNMNTAANYCLINNINLQEALGWSELSINTYFGVANFTTLSTYTGLLEKLDR
jgi:hypothetical protein